MAQKIVEWNLRRYPEGNTAHDVNQFLLLIQASQVYFSFLALGGLALSAASRSLQSNFTRKQRLSNNNTEIYTMYHFGR